MLQRLFIVPILILLIGCSDRDKKIEENYFIASRYDGTGNTKGNMLFKFWFSDSLLLQDTIHMSIFKYASHDIEDSYLSLNFPSDYDLKKVERHTRFYPTIWSDTQKDVSQLLKLNDLVFNANRDIHNFNPQNYKRSIYSDGPDADRKEINKIEKHYKIFLKSKNVLHYPAIYTTDYIKNHFKNITQKELSTAINAELDKEEGMTTEEKTYWRSHTRKYIKGAFAEDGDTYTIPYFEVYLVLNMEKNGKPLKKVLKYDNHIGN